MKKFFARAVVAFALVFAVTVPVLADTIRLKDGSVIRGQIISFKNEQFTIPARSDIIERLSRAVIDGQVAGAADLEVIADLLLAVIAFAGLTRADTGQLGGVLQTLRVGIAANGTA